MAVRPSSSSSGAESPVSQETLWRACTGSARLTPSSRVPSSTIANTIAVVPNLRRVATSQRLASPTITCNLLYLSGSACGSSRVLMIGLFRVVSSPTSSSKKSARWVNWNGTAIRSNPGASQPTFPAPVKTWRVTRWVVACWTIRPKGVDRSIR